MGNTVPERLARIETLLTGINDKLDALAGHEVRIDRLEQLSRMTGKVLWPAVSATIGLILNAWFKWV